LLVRKSTHVNECFLLCLYLTPTCIEAIPPVRSLY